MAKIIGNRPGHHHSAVAVHGGRQVKVIEKRRGPRTTPSVIAYLEDGEILVGRPAKRQPYHARKHRCMQSSA